MNSAGDTILNSNARSKYVIISWFSPKSTVTPDPLYTGTFCISLNVILVYLQ